jgi:hypothetical protein
MAHGITSSDEIDRVVIILLTTNSRNAIRLFVFSLV